MKKRTHLLVTKFMLRGIDLSCKYKLLVCFGSIKPDLTIMCVIKPHKYNIRFNDVTKLLSKLDFNNKDWLYYYRVGILTHFFADFFTDPHNRVGVKGFCFNHRNYESRLHRFFKDNINDFNIISERDVLLKNYLVNLHTKYIESDIHEYENDFNYICMIINNTISSLC